MKSSIGQYFYSVCRQATQEFRQFGQKATQHLMRTPLPKILIIVLAIALLIAIIPLAISLFVIFVLLKLFAGMLVLNSRPDKTEQTRKVYIHRRFDRD
ncbi:hypothetical protein [Undibacterium sp. TJN19]|uniref:hypothetical protein n=1 Tax=Undibacterium sp. TJN19 TaxID=3413055 RepID=UPI003BF06F16